MVWDKQDQVKYFLTVNSYKKNKVGDGEGMYQQSAEGFYGSENTLYDTAMMDMCHYAWSKSMKRTTPGVKHDGNLHFG